MSSKIFVDGGRPKRSFYIGFGHDEEVSDYTYFKIFGLFHIFLGKKIFFYKIPQGKFLYWKFPNGTQGKKFFR